jgi:ABC-2 type transport system ATP-binding protein
MIYIENLNFRYKRRPVLFDGMNLSLNSGRIYGLLGRNGAGKTTLLKIMMGMLFPKGGACRVLGYESRKRQPAMLADMMFVPEEFYAPEMTIRRYVDLYAPFYPAFSRDQFRVYLDELELTDGEHFNSFSLGQKKRAVLAFALAENTRVLLLDEPTNGLDIPAKAQFRRMLASVVADDKCVIISTHQVRDVEKLIDAVL